MENQIQEWSETSILFNTVQSRIDEQIKDLDSDVTISRINSFVALDVTVNEAVDAESVLSALCWFPDQQDDEEESLQCISDCIVSEVAWLQESRSTDCIPRRLTYREETRNWLVLRFLKSTRTFIPTPAEDWKELSNWEQDLEWRRAGIEESPEVVVRKEILSDEMSSEQLVGVETAVSSVSFFESLVYNDTTHDGNRPVAVGSTLSRYDALVAANRGSSGEESHASQVSSPKLDAKQLPDVRRVGTLHKPFATLAQVAEPETPPIIILPSGIGSPAKNSLAVAPLSEKRKKSKQKKSFNAKMKRASKADHSGCEVRRKSKSKKRLMSDSPPIVAQANTAVLIKSDHHSIDSASSPLVKRPLEFPSKRRRAQRSSRPDKTLVENNELIDSVECTKSPQQIEVDNSLQEQEPLDTSLENDIRSILQHKIKSEGWFLDDAENVPKKKKKYSRKDFKIEIYNVVRSAIKKELKVTTCTADKASQAGPGVIATTRVVRRRTESVENSTQARASKRAGTSETADETLPIREAPTRNRRKRGRELFRVDKEVQADCQPALVNVAVNTPEAFWHCSNESCGMKMPGKRQIKTENSGNRKSLNPAKTNRSPTVGKNGKIHKKVKR